MALNSPLFDEKNALIKRVFDLSLICLTFPILFPFMLFIWVILKATGVNSPIFSQKRIGLNGKKFSFFKFRTMVKDADAILKTWIADHPDIKTEFEEKFKLRGDPRITYFGKFLRRTSLDELPQIFNIIKGDMSLVGPRPIVQDEISKYGTHVDDVFRVKPGLSGLWQVSGRNDVSYERRIELDLEYLKKWSIWLDFVILFKTFRAALDGKGAY